MEDLVQPLVVDEDNLLGTSVLEVRQYAGLEVLGRKLRHCTQVLFTPVQCIFIDAGQRIFDKYIDST